MKFNYLRDIECCLRTMNEKLYHMGIRGKISPSTLADANEKRDCHIFRDFAQILNITFRNDKITALPKKAREKR